MRNPCEIIFFVAYLLNYWEGLQKHGDKKLVVAGATRLMKAASDLMEMQDTRNAGRRMVVYEN